MDGMINKMTDDDKLVSFGLAVCNMSSTVEKVARFFAQRHENLMAPSQFGIYIQTMAAMKKMALRITIFRDTRMSVRLLMPFAMLRLAFIFLLLRYK